MELAIHTESYEVSFKAYVSINLNGAYVNKVIMFGKNGTENKIPCFCCFQIYLNSELNCLNKT